MKLTGAVTGSVDGENGVLLLIGSKSDVVVVTGGDGSGFILHAILESSDTCSSWYVCCSCNYGHILLFD